MGRHLNFPKAEGEARDLKISQRRAMEKNWRDLTKVPGEGQSVFKIVCYVKANKMGQVQILKDGKHTYLGLFDDGEEAARWKKAAQA